MQLTAPESIVESSVAQIISARIFHWLGLEFRKPDMHEIICRFILYPSQNYITYDEERFL
jgi:hypothetical protein